MGWGFSGAPAVHTPHLEPGSGGLASAWGRGQAAPKDPIMWGVGPAPTQLRSLSGGRPENRGPLSARHGVPEVRVRAGSPSSALGLPVATTCPGYPPLALGTRAGAGAALPEFTARERRKHEVRTARPAVHFVGFSSLRGVPEGRPAPLSGARPLLTITSPPPFKGGGRGPPPLRGRSVQELVAVLF